VRRYALTLVAALVACLAATTARAQCDPPSPPPVPCTSDAGCPPTYGCADNGTGLRYCVGAACAADAECGGGGICRAYCTLDGCGPRRCMSPGFGCVGQDVLCMQNGGSIACRMVCTQDSDCVHPFGLVCINAGFADGVCIGNTPCF
jgi:hypothetical protein